MKNCCNFELSKYLEQNMVIVMKAKKKYIRNVMIYKINREHYTVDAQTALVGVEVNNGNCCVACVLPLAIIV